jgi:hypothetical protein
MGNEDRPEPPFHRDFSIAAWMILLIVAVFGAGLIWMMLAR